jgi:hypothetical protein
MAIDASWRWIAWTILGIGGLIAAGGVLMGLGNLRYALHGERADGIVIENVREGDMYAPVVQFRLPRGETVEAKDLGAGEPDFSVGDRVTVLYFPESPRDFRLDTFVRLWLMPIIITGFGGFWLMFGAVGWALSRNADLALVGERAFSVISLSALLIGVLVLWSTVELYSSGGRARGTVTEIRESRSIVSEEVTIPGGREVHREVERITLAPIVRFVTAEGREIEFHGRGGSGTSFEAGELVDVVYDRSQPSRARIVSFVDLWLPAAVAFAVSVLFGGAVVLSRWGRRKR